jgi:hypothetical protein
MLFIWQCGASNALFCDNVNSQIDKAVQEMYALKDFKCEPHYQHQNVAERQIQEAKRLVTIM